MSLIKTINRNFLLPLIKTSHLSELIAKFSTNNNLILNYHGVVKKYQPQLSKNHLDLRQFEYQMKYFKKEFNILSLENIFHNKIANKNKKDRKNIAITFDDGYLNNLENAFPILNNLQIPATIFVTGQSITNPNLPLWYDLFDILSSKLQWETIKDELINNLPIAIEISNLENYGKFKRFIKTTSPNVKNELIQLLNNVPLFSSEINNCDSEYWKIMNVENLKMISRSNLIEIGSHGFTHSNLDQLNMSELEIELKNSKTILEDCIQKPVESIAFPDGAYNEEVKNASLSMGYKRLLAVNYRCASDNKDSTILPRLSISNTTTSDSIIIQTNISFNKLGF